MLDVCLLGSGGMMPLPYRWLTALMMRYNGSSVLIDCGEGTQIAVKEKGWSFKPIDVIWPAGASAHHGKCGADGAADVSGTQGAGTGGQRLTRHRAGVALSH